MNVPQIIDAIWIGLGIFWVAGAVAVKTTARAESSGSRSVHIILMLAAFALLFDPQLRIGALASRFVADSPDVAYVGLAITFAGAAVAVWARLYIGRNWSANVAVKQDHELIRSGPYAVVRHPIYSGLLLAILGTAIAFGEVRGLVAFALALVGWRTKSLAEERIMEEQFGASYAEYKSHVKALIPFVL